MALLYALTTRQRDTDSAQRTNAAARTAAERQQAFERMRDDRQAGVMTIYEICPQRSNGRGIKVYGGEATQSATHHAERKPATTAE